MEQDFISNSMNFLINEIPDMHKICVSSVRELSKITFLIMRASFLVFNILFQMRAVSTQGVVLWKRLVSINIVL